MKLVRHLTLLLAAALVIPAMAQDEDAPNPYAGLKWRNIGPAFMSGRISDIDWDPTDDSVWYIAVGSGGVWKTTNAGTTFTPIFDKESAYSIGNVTVDPSNPHTVWVGTGEDVGGPAASSEPLEGAEDEIRIAAADAAINPPIKKISDICMPFPS